MIEPLESPGLPPEVTDKINELIEAHNMMLESMPGGIRRRMESAQLRAQPPAPEPEE